MEEAQNLCVSISGDLDPIGDLGIDLWKIIAALKAAICALTTLPRCPTNQGCHTWASLKPLVNG